jgi:aminoglycoside 6'-N-acetyltransferase I
VIRIRPLQDHDNAEWLRLRQALWSESPQGGLCGFVEVSIRTEAPGCTTDRIGYLEAWYVDEAWRGKGVGRSLVVKAEDWARSAGCLEMASDTTPEYPISPVAHEALGYEETERYFRKSLE